MTAPPPECGMEKKRLLAELLAARMGDRLVDVSSAVHATFFSAAHEKICGAAPKTGRVFLTSAAVARRGNLTKNMIFHGERQAVVAASPTEGTDLGDGGKLDAEENRWIRGVLIVSGSIPPPPESTFLDRCGNGLTFSFGMHETSPRLLVRVVGVPLPLFLPPGPNADCATKKAVRETRQEKYRQLILESEHRFLRGLEACLLWLLRCRRYEKMQKLLPPRQSSEKHESQISGERTGHASSFLSSFFHEETATLSVPLYYLPMHIDDNVTSRLADVIDVATAFMDWIVDADMSLVKESTALLQELVRLSRLMERGAEYDNDYSKRNNNNNNKQQNTDEFLYLLHRHVASLLEARHQYRSHVNKENNNTNTTIHNNGRAFTLPIVCYDDEYSMPLSELVLDDSLIDLLPQPRASDDDYDSNSSNAFSSIETIHDFREPQGQVTLAKDEYGVVCTAHSLPGVLVHCMKGVSRSPSVIMAYYMQKCCRQFYTLSFTPRHTILEETIASNIEDDIEDAYIFSFRHLLRCLQEARPVVNPQVCFLAELRAMWTRLSRDMADKEAEELL
ncbi:hypothetical protein ECC02_004226 [Trypanosoma cruzi]|uniref:Tyrosine specific protein phosphatases domain-containing protein n=1 Tax=Trypanosoma cruzi TaxID=5693 RepID=A0A7J6Y7K5_TRYCR|nr:hypothetical protein ECC02_004226 [Trypanosoma cruzi]